LIPDHFGVRPAAALGAAFAWLARHARWLRIPLVFAVALSVAWLVSRGAAIWDDRLESLSPGAESDKRLDAAMRRDLGAPDVRYLAVAMGDTQQAALEAAERVGAALERARRAESIGGLESPARILPSDATQRARQAAIPDADALRDNLDQAVQGLPFQPRLFEPFLRDAAAARQQALITAGDLAGTALALRLDSLLSQRDDGWMAVLPLRAVREAAVATRELSGVSGVHLLDLKGEADTLYRGYRDQALQLALIGAAGIALLLLVALRSVRRAAEVLLPL